MKAEKACSKCKETKPLEQFNRSATFKDGYAYACKKCNAEYCRGRYSTEERCDKSLRKHYGISLADKKNMLAEQNWGCLICKSAFKSMSDAHVDHDHQTFKIRGLLCSNCNNGLGRFKDSFDALLNAAKYIQTHKEVI